MSLQVSQKEINTNTSLLIKQCHCLSPSKNYVIKDNQYRKSIRYLYCWWDRRQPRWKRVNLRLTNYQKDKHCLGERILWKLPVSGILAPGSPEDSAIPNFDLFICLPDKDRTSFPTSISTTLLTTFFQQVPYGDGLLSSNLLGGGTLKFDTKNFAYFVEILEHKRCFLSFHLWQDRVFWLGFKSSTLFLPSQFNHLIHFGKVHSQKTPINFDGCYSVIWNPLMTYHEHREQEVLKKNKLKQNKV